MSLPGRPRPRKLERRQRGANPTCRPFLAQQMGTAGSQREDPSMSRSIHVAWRIWRLCSRVEANRCPEKRVIALTRPGLRPPRELTARLRVISPSCDGLPRHHRFPPTEPEEAPSSPVSGASSLPKGRKEARRLRGTTGLLLTLGIGAPGGVTCGDEWAPKCSRMENPVV
jgi:hypothetical protein